MAVVPVQLLGLPVALDTTVQARGGSRCRALGALPGSRPPAPARPHASNTVSTSGLWRKSPSLDLERRAQRLPGTCSPDGGCVLEAERTRTTTPGGYCGRAPRPPARGWQSTAAPAPCRKMAPAGRGCGCWGGSGSGVVLWLLLLLLGALACARATEHYSPLSLLKQELQHRQQQEAPAGGGCPQSGDWADQYPECGEWAGLPSPCGRPYPVWKHLGGGESGDGLRRAMGTRSRAGMGQEVRLPFCLPGWVSWAQSSPQESNPERYKPVGSAG